MASLPLWQQCPRTSRCEAAVPIRRTIRLPQTTETRRTRVDVRRVQAADDRVSASEAAAASLEGEQIAAVMRESGRQSGYTVLITGSTKGVGRALAEKFLTLGDRVVVCSRSKDAVDATVAELGAKYGATNVAGTACDVSNATDLERLAAFATASFGSVDVWINNAGTNAYSYGPLCEQDPEELVQIAQTNLLGVLLANRQAIRTMREQPSGGHIFNMDGAGADGNATPRFAAYGATKHALVQLNRSLSAELKTAGLDSKIQVHNLSPGMVTTELLMSGASTSQAKWFINCLAEQAETVADFLVPRVRAVPGMEASGSIKSQDIRFLTKPDAFKRIISKALLGINKDRWVKEQ